MRIYYFGELVSDGTDKQPNKQKNSPYIQEVIKDGPANTLLAFHRKQKFVIRDFAHA